MRSGRAGASSSSRWGDRATHRVGSRLYVRYRAPTLRTALSQRSLLSQGLRRLEQLTAHRLAPVVVFAVALGVHSIRSIAWPVAAGPDLDDFLRYYVQIDDADALLPASMLTKTPLSPIVIGLSLDLVGGALAEPLMALLFAGSVVAWYAAGLTFGPRVAIVTALALLLYPGYGEIFHEAASEPVFAAGFAGWAVLVTRAARRPSAARFAAVGLGVALLALVRPGDQVLVAFALFPLILPGTWKRRLAWAGALGGSCVVVLAAWAVHNGLRYGEYTVARGGQTALFHHAFVVDRIVQPENGPASRRLADAVRRHLLTREPYRSYGVTLDQVFSSGSLRISEDLGLLSDEVFGWSSSTLRDAGIEAVRAHLGKYASNVLKTIWLELSEPFYRIPPASGEPSPRPPETVVVGGQRLPHPGGGELIPSGQSYWISRPDRRIRLVWTSPTHWTYVFRDPRDKPRFEQIQRRMDELFDNLPDRDGSAALSLRLNQLSRWYPRPIGWLGVGLLVLALRRPRSSRTLLALAASALLVIGVTALFAPTALRYAIPVSPAFALLGVGALLGRRTEAVAAVGS